MNDIIKFCPLGLCVSFEPFESAKKISFFLIFTRAANDFNGFVYFSNWNPDNDGTFTNCNAI